MEKFFINIITFIPKVIIIILGVIIGIIGILMNLGLMGYIKFKMGFRSMFDFLTCEGN